MFRSAGVGVQRLMKGFTESEDLECNEKDETNES
jgi:hypothetical protein